MKTNPKSADTLRDALGDMARGLSAGGNTLAMMQLSGGTDFCELLKGLPDDACQCPHWGYVLQGQLVVDYTSGQQEIIEAGEMYYCEPGHSVAAPIDTKYIEFSPTDQLMDVLDHAISKMG